MLLRLTTTHTPATDLSFILHKHPDRVQTFPLPFGSAHIFYPEASAERCTIALLLDVDPVALVRGNRGSEGMLSQYVNDRPYVASSLLCVAMGDVFSSAMAGICKKRPELVDLVLPLTVELPVVAVRAKAGLSLIQRLFEPLGYQVSAEPIANDNPANSYLALKLTANLTVKQLLTHIYVLIPVLDNAKHYWIGNDEVSKLLRKGDGWLAQHPECELITTRYLRYQKSLTSAALEHLLQAVAPETTTQTELDQEQVSEPTERQSLHTQRHNVIVQRLKASGAQRILDLGCGEGKLLRELLKESQFSAVVGMDLSTRALAILQQRIERLPERQRQRLSLLHGSLLYRDARLKGFDAAAIVEVLEHLELGHLAAFERTVFGFARPKLVLVTTPNREYNQLFPSLPADQLRHRHHRFEWTRAEFAVWAERVAASYNYRVSIEPLGPEDPNHGAPSQLGVFEDAT
ncbi:MAG TPA: 3' terminal RNA ribose 2'-O-methyltransferase Hen1 [Herpetosiphon sp.]|uniref:Small RNA 2'-O-methyltransferase n=1 Tax=Herpetosiphon aurantiacus (strain ATCC 23779 / DSM 785 / 114-95) TaxID=316274 RepID=A9B3Q1_HERA2|nr:3' terminal RNA ribose 2'-O-methyltransferase Hen1 [Herpetosiphon sp.]ABX05623.1 Methyltransferase type 12 [Herpetosiphon aurantiacus DSM 785]HBW52172.1 3' terminal RNA ribose 2'-O-methyltransferase Hen1 [Herpetosiphon sp.]